MRFEWDDKKNAANFKKHGIRFERAVHVFSDPNAKERYDECHSNTEVRFSLIGFDGYRVLYVIFTEPDEKTIRIISARKASGDEMEDYYGNG